MSPDEPIEHELLRNAVAAEVTVTSSEVSPTSTGDRYVRIEGNGRDGLPRWSVHAHHNQSRRGGEPVGGADSGEEGPAPRSICRRA